jgi:hypothetical protein
VHSKVLYVPLATALAALKAGDTPNLSGDDRAKSLKLIDAYGSNFCENSLFGMLNNISGSRDIDLVAAKTIYYFAASTSQLRRDPRSRQLKQKIDQLGKPEAAGKASILSFLQDARGIMGAIDYDSKPDIGVSDTGTEVGAKLSHAISMHGGDHRHRATT